MNDAEIFHAARPYYDPQHVREIATAMRNGGIPFCVTCADWHFPGEEHTEG